jgi:hypothetical protein
MRRSLADQPRSWVRSLPLLAAVVAGAVLCYRFPDLDIPLLGIGNHRYFLFHSAIVPIAAWVALRPARRARGRLIAAGLAASFALGVGVHLFTDVFQSKSVVFPFIGTLVRGTSLDDRLWEGANAAVCGVLAWVSFAGSRRQKA